MITPVTIPIPSIPMPAWAHQLIMLIAGLAIAVSATVSIWGPGVGFASSDIAAVAGWAIAIATVLRALDAATETVVKNAEIVQAEPGGSVSIVSTTNRKTMRVANAILPSGAPLAAAGAPAPRPAAGPAPAVRIDPAI